jgi:hypothetical protein
MAHSGSFDERIGFHQRTMGMQVQEGWYVFKIVSIANSRTR